MRRYCHWIVLLWLLAVTPGIVMAGPLSFLDARSKKPVAQSPHKLQPPGTPKKTGNQQTAEQIAAALQAAKLNGYNIQIEFKNGTATLTGMIADRKQQAKATKVVKRVAGVKNVENRLSLIPQQIPRTVGGKRLEKSTASKSPRRSLFKKWPVRTAGYRRDDGPKSGQILPVSGNLPTTTNMTAIHNNQQVAEQIASALKSARLNGYDIEIRYQHGVAALNGTVADMQQKVRATQVVLQVRGVKSVDNRLMVGLQQASSVARPMPVGPQPMPNAAPWPVPNRPGVPVAFQPAAGQPPMPPQNGMPPPAAAPGPAMPGVGPAMPGVGPPPNYGHPGQGASHTVYDMPHLPNYAWPSYAHYPNSAQVSYPQQYSASAWPYIGPFYPYPQIPLGWRRVQLEWDDGYWNLNFDPRTDKWFWFLNPKYW